VGWPRVNDQNPIVVHRRPHINSAAPPPWGTQRTFQVMVGVLCLDDLIHEIGDDLIPPDQLPLRLGNPAVVPVLALLPLTARRTLTRPLGLAGYLLDPEMDPARLDVQFSRRFANGNAVPRMAAQGVCLDCIRDTTPSNYRGTRLVAGYSYSQRAFPITRRPRVSSSLRRLRVDARAEAPAAATSVEPERRSAFHPGKRPLLPFLGNIGKDVQTVEPARRSCDDGP